MNCQCTNPGYCEKHQRYKSDRMIYLCQTNPAYFEHWEKGPTQPAPKPKRKVPYKLPGNILHNRLMHLGFNFREGCPCEDRMTKMNLWGPEGCKERIDEITEWLLESAEKTNILTNLLSRIPFLGKQAIRLFILDCIQESQEDKNEYLRIKNL